MFGTDFALNSHVTFIHCYLHMLLSGYVSVPLFYDFFVYYNIPLCNFHFDEPNLYALLFYMHFSTKVPPVMQGDVIECENPTNHSDEGGFAELEEILKQKTFTRQDDLNLYRVDVKLKCMVICAILLKGNFAKIIWLVCDNLPFVFVCLLPCFRIL